MQPTHFSEPFVILRVAFESGGPVQIQVELLILMFSLYLYILY